MRSESFPPIVVRSYLNESRLKKDARRLRKLGYQTKFKTLDKYPPHHWYATYERTE